MESICLKLTSHVCWMHREKDNNAFHYYWDLFNLVNLHIPICDAWMRVNNEIINPKPVAEGGLEIENIIINKCI
jgi:hypothetical protein